MEMVRASQVPRRRWRTRLCNPTLRSGANHVIPLRPHLDEVVAVAARVSHVRHPSPVADLYPAIAGRAEFPASLNGPIQIRHDEIEVYRRPVSLEAAGNLPSSEVCGRRAVSEKKYRQVCAFQLDPAPSPPPLQRERQSTALGC